MASELAPCGTYAAYRRHLRAKETPCEPCSEAARSQKNERAEADRASSAEVVALAIANEPEIETLDELGEALENLRIVKAAMHEAPANTIAALSKRREELVHRVSQLQKADKPEMSALDQLAQRRAERLSRAAN